MRVDAWPNSHVLVDSAIVSGSYPVHFSLVGKKRRDFLDQDCYGDNFCIKQMFKHDGNISNKFMTAASFFVYGSTGAVSICATLNSNLNNHTNHIN